MKGKETLKKQGPIVHRSGKLVFLREAVKKLFL